MADNNPKEDVSIPEAGSQAAPESVASQGQKKSMTPGVRFGLMIGFVFVAIAGSMFVTGKTFTDQASQIKEAPKLDSTPGGAVQAESPRYQQILEEANEQAAIAASEEGRTFIPTPEIILQPIENLEAGTPEEEVVSEPEVEKKPEPEKVEETKTVVVTPPPPPPPPAPVARPAPSQEAAGEQKNPFVESMLQQMGAIAQTNITSDLIVGNTGEADRQAEEDAAAAALAAQAATTAGAEALDVIIPSGEIIYAETLTGTNSDLPGSPVLVELTSGEFKGSRLVGGFTVNQASKAMVVQFTSISLPDGTSVPVSAFAVDGITAEAAVASDVERRLVSRYAPILASAFITSYAEARAEPEQTLTDLGDGTTAIVQERRDTEQALYAGLGAATAAIGQDLINNAPKGPKIVLKSGWPIAVIFVEPVSVAR